MITPTLEKLILSGKATYKTLIAGGSEKMILNVTKNRFVIITDITYFPTVNAVKSTMTLTDFNNLQQRANTQLRVFSSKSFNTFLFRNNVNLTVVGDSYILTPQSPTKLDTFLIHESDVAFSFSYAGQIQDIQRLPTDPRSVGYAPPMDYGKLGQVGAIPVRRIGAPLLDSAGNYKVLNQGLGIANATTDAYSSEFDFPVDALNRAQFQTECANYMIVNVGYVEIQGTPTNIAGTI